MKVIAEYPPAEMYAPDLEIDCQCARCGSSASSEECLDCGGDGVDGHDCGDDCCCCLHPEDNMECQYCRGQGVYHVCLSSSEFCQANPLPGRENVERGAIEWFTTPIGKL
jgi:hypothetical protein